jgi:hypothetical protein
MTGWKGLQKSSCDHVKVIFQQLPGDIELKPQNLGHGNQCLNRNSDPGPPEYEAGILTTICNVKQLRRAVMNKLHASQPAQILG